MMNDYCRVSRAGDVPRVPAVVVATVVAGTQKIVTLAVFCQFLKAFG